MTPSRRAAETAMTYEEAQTYRDRLKTAVDMSHADHRMHRMMQTVVHEVMSDHASLDHDETEAAYRIASDAALMAFAMIYSDDDEISRLKAERDAYKAYAERLVSLTPMQPIIYPVPA